jgi:hypothetical protein
MAISLNQRDYVIDPITTDSAAEQLTQVSPHPAGYQVCRRTAIRHQLSDSPNFSEARRTAVHEVHIVQLRGAFNRSTLFMAADPHARSCPAFALFDRNYTRLCSPPPAR